MNDIVEKTAAELCAIYIDMGTTNTRVWLMRGNQVLARAGKPVGVRDSTLEGSTARIQATLKELIANVQSRGCDSSNPGRPVCIAAAGMISAPLGLAPLSHLYAPAGAQELSSAARWFEFPDICALPFLIVPGVRSGPVTIDLRSLGTSDAMRGEETLCAGLQILELIQTPSVVLTLGSHWKAIKVDAHGQICSSITTLSGELIHAVQTQTILAGSVSNIWPSLASHDWMEGGMQEQRRSGLARTLFCVRLLELSNEGTPVERFSFLLGAFLAADLDALMRSGTLTVATHVIISGHAAVADGWAYALKQMSIAALVLSEEQTERAFLSGLKAILSGALARKDMGLN